MDGLLFALLRYVHVPPRPVVIVEPWEEAELLPHYTGTEIKQMIEERQKRAAK